MNISVNVVLSNGSVDLDATRAAFETALASFVTARETEQAGIATAVHAVFDEHLGKTLTMPTLAQYATQKLNAQPENLAVLTERTKQYIRDNKEGDSSLFLVVKGKSGGVRRRSDLPAAAE